MTKEEYEDCISKLETGTLYEKLQASMILSLFPTYENKIPTNEGILKVEEVIKGFNYD